MLDLMLWAFIALLPCQLEIVVDLRLAPSDLFLLLALLLGGPSLRFIRHAWSLWHFAIPAVILGGAFLAAVDRGELSRYIVVNKCLGIGVLVLFYMLVTTAAASWQQIRMMLRILVASVVVLNVAAMLAYLSGRVYGVHFPWLNSNPYRLCGMLVDANGYGGLLLIAFLCNEVVAAGGKPLLGSVFTKFASTTLLLGIVLTFSRSTWLALATVSAASLLVHPRVALRIAMYGVLALSIVPFLGSNALGYARDMASRPGQVTQRFDIIFDAFHYFSRQPFFGMGLGGFLDREDVIVHNTALWFLAEFGVIGLFVLTGFLFWFFWKGAVAYRLAPEQEKPVLMALLLGHLAVCALSLGIEAFYMRPWWLIFALIASAYSIVVQPNGGLPHARD
ncbi:MAG: O-antigen ligase family protein [Bryobacteraceae bacterium]